MVSIRGGTHTGDKIPLSSPVLEYGEWGGGNLGKLVRLLRPVYMRREHFMLRALTKPLVKNEHLHRLAHLIIISSSASSGSVCHVSFFFVFLLLLRMFFFPL